MTTIEADRRVALDRALAPYLAGGATLESSTGTTAVVLVGKPVNHLLHLILSVLTAGLWLIVWVVLILSNKRQRLVFSVGENGEVQQVTGPVAPPPTPAASGDGWR
jgi:hypothetical protein